MTEVELRRSYQHIEFIPEELIIWIMVSEVLI